MRKAILFDFDGTIADTLPLIFHSFQVVLAKYTGIQYSDSDILGMFGPPEDGIIAKKVPEEKRDEALQELFNVYDKSHPELVRVEPEMMSMLNRLKENEFLLGVVTGKGRRSADISFKHLQLTSLFDTVITGNDVTKPKPHPEGLLKAMTHLGVQPENTMYVGDSNVDVVAGKRAGVKTVGVHWLSNPQTVRFEEQPDKYFRSVASFMGWIVSQR